MNKERIMAVLMLAFFLLAWAAIIYGLVINSEELILSGFGVFIAVFLYSRYAKRRMDALREEERLRNAQKEEKDIEQER